MGQFLGPDNLPQLQKATATTLTLAATFKGRPTTMAIGGQQYALSSALTLNTATTGVGGLDTGTIASFVTYWVYGVLSGSTPALVASTNSPTTGPTGFAQWSLVGAFRTRASNVIDTAIDHNFAESTYFGIGVAGGSNAPFKVTPRHIQIGVGPENTDLWSTANGALKIGEFGYLYSHGSFGLGLHWNFYRGGASSSHYTSLAQNSQIGAAGLEMDSGGVRFLGQTTFAGGTTDGPLQIGAATLPGVWTLGNISSGANISHTVYGSVELFATSGSNQSVFRARYQNATADYSGTYGWYTIQLGNNGGNILAAGRTTTGGLLDIYTNVTTASTGGNWVPDGVRAARFSADGGCTFGNSTTGNNGASHVFFTGNGSTHGNLQINTTAGPNNDRGSGVQVLANGVDCGLMGWWKHASVTNACGYLYFYNDNRGFRYLWLGNDAVWRTSATATDIGRTAGTAVGDQTSDVRLKNSVVDYNDGLDVITQIETIRYKLNIDDTGSPRVGFNAAQLQTLIPEAVYAGGDLIEGTEERALSLRSEAIIPALVNAVKQLKAKNDELEARLAVLEV